MFGFNKMVIELKKIGTTLISRQTGKEAFLAIQPILQNVKSGEAVEIDFKGVLTFSPSWGAEFLMPLLKKYGDNLILKNTRNGSVQSTLEFLEQIENKKFMRYNK
ncbi:MAG: hypothetical protein A2528_01305 [Candidatus Staskawiczbacteria bacterium RIFOXYD2_FULL_37_9]|uniref:Uncharacterized protein n=1 Tax=Candidatus Staskawiczbacteria bacterium RIFOXYB1_FULL_37_44 TaxID=1802223 RepID=A0A1G2IUT1_9BACT|nr:MAG: hypothetical protein A2358_01905 [Candidatus Staskawiczbacteria bacterium RIFOXYB1_FULL_37_44]OGZ83275.1 MAG: hypothetical protein A2416_00480 [Candidatus Staskawiczbacteria bacterium RIFOXYC1_FULL_37_52]OGZ87338.1 MAG: hypothetical protein A2444_00275 [Candidatus Staskawiczbacteria bacterium RIFOXYC2_FULL_37_19]OGZ89333.1 MAG: hypothetical protein A2581_00425 [Candidatus Staskawiczbacteria bacterium RIFOXYD1_FULL_37_110]OGZ94571.1 MAG: hypothetical protein A2528_01305 [Candidatus Stask